MIKWCDECLADPQGGWTQEAQAYLVIAMARWQLNERKQAQAALERAIRILQDNQPDFVGEGSDSWHGWLICQHLRREAESTMRAEIARDAQIDFVDEPSDNKP
ncbi:MAG: tetratricopeptide repeat protein [Pirellulaceae bacterium]|nr:tetratricopeptide repeat protein [Pirellulaceae bacterium]